MSELPPKTPFTRRSFTLRATVATMAAIWPAREARAGAEVPAQAHPNPMDKLSPGARSEVEAKVKEIFRRYGSRLTEAQKGDIGKVMAETQDGLERMRSFVLTNGDQPATVFKLTTGEKANGHVE
jgi:hypothetical protein